MCGVTCVLVVLLACVTAQCPQSVINNVGDFILKELVLNSPDLVALPNVTGRFFYNQGRVSASHGSLFGLYSIKRYGDIGLYLRNDTAKLSFRVTFDYLAVNYERYEARLLGLSTEAVLDAAVDNAILAVAASMGQGSLCFLTVDSVRFVSMDALKVRLKSECKVCSKLTSSLTTTAVNFFKDRLRYMVQARLDEALWKILKPGNSLVCKEWKL